MNGNIHVQFLGEGVAATSPPYPTVRYGVPELRPIRSGWRVDLRQPQHIRLAANRGLGIFEFNSPRGWRFSFDHRIINQA